MKKKDKINQLESDVCAYREYARDLYGIILDLYKIIDTEDDFRRRHYCDIDGTCEVLAKAYERFTDGLSEAEKSEFILTRVKVERVKINRTKVN